MQTFLQQSAQYIFDSHALPGSLESSLGRSGLDRVCIVLPTRRAVFFFKQSLATQSDLPFLSPDVVAIDDFIQQTCEMEPIDPVSLMFEAFDIFKAIDPNIEFDRFTSWASTMLLDFDRIDQYRLDAKAVFSYVSEAKALERWSPEMPLYNRKGGSADTTSPITEKYFLLFDNLYKVYSALRDRLFATTRAYRGMAYRWLSENVELLLLDNPKYDYFYFVGLNALSASEEYIIQRLVKAKRAQTLWDTDSYYMQKNPDMKAGELLRKYKREGQFGPWNWQGNHLLTDHKHIRIIGVANASMQAKVAGQLYAEWRQEDVVAQAESKQAANAGHVEEDFFEEIFNILPPYLEKKPAEFNLDRMTAMVLADENLLTPVMYSLDESVEDFNITMGLSLRNSTLFTLVDILFELQRATIVDAKNAEGMARKVAKFSHRSVLKVLNHPFIRRYELVVLDAALTSVSKPSAPPANGQPEQTAPQNIVRRTVREIISRNKVLLTSQELLNMGEDHALFKTLFTSWEGKPARALQCLYQVIDLLRSVYRENKDAIETEYLFLFYTLLKRLETILSERHEQVTMRSFRIFLYELIRQTKMPFSGEPASQLQIIGMLETRALDFEKLIIMSVNEKILPLAKRQNSLIPFDACTEFGLPTHGDQDAIMAYHFYRLLQRAKEVVLLYVLPSDTYGGFEKSRFIHQIENELAKQNPNIRLIHQSVGLPANLGQAQEEVVLRVQKNPRILEQMHEQISRKGIYPSHLNMFINCSMQYYFNRLVQIADDEEVEEKLGNDTFGEWIHKTLENIDRELSAIEANGRNRLVQKEDIEAILESLPSRLRKEFDAAYGGYEGDTGMNHLLYKVAGKILHRFFQNQLDNEIFPIEVLGLEKSLSTSFMADIGGKRMEVKIGGKVDRIDRVGGHTIRVIDYKTGKVEGKDLDIKGDSITDALLHDRKADKVRQLWLYKYIISKKILLDKGLRLENRFVDTADNQVISGIYSFRNIGEGLLENKLAFQPSGETMEAFVAESERYLSQVVAQLLDPEQPFEKTIHLEVCTWCSYKGICGR
ncbi:MAG: PD-(D/E)XK nuclease family protein [Bacteroidota bacterium]